MLTNTLLLYVTQEAWARARQRLIAGRNQAADHHDGHLAPRWLEEAERRLKSAAELRRWPPRTRH
jgi:hypothetical protein